MKLLTKTGLYYLVFSIILFTTGALIFYLQLKKIIAEEITENLYLEKEQIQEFVKDSSRIPLQDLSFGDKIFFSKESVDVKEKLKDTVLYNPIEEEYEEYKQLIFPVKTGDQIFSVNISKPMFESEDLIEGIVKSFAITCGVLFILLFILTNVLSKTIWKPFYNTLGILNNLDLNKKKIIIFPAAKIYEFRILNEELQKVTDKIFSDYNNLKEFTENASHEIQTPLAIIRSKLEILMQSENFSSDQMSLLQNMYESANRLSKLNQSLLLLAKIENRQFYEMHSVDLKNLIEKKLAQFEDMILHKKIIIEKNFNATPKININSYLADILFSNIIGNAIRHNNHDGKINIELNPDSVKISNSGPSPGIDPEKLFERFQKGNVSSESAGLGLSIVKQVCNIYNFTLKYKYSEGLHTINIKF